MGPAGPTKRARPDAHVQVGASPAGILAPAVESLPVLLPLAEPETVEGPARKKERPGGGQDRTEPVRAVAQLGTLLGCAQDADRPGRHAGRGRQPGHEWLRRGGLVPLGGRPPGRLAGELDPPVPAVIAAHDLEPLVTDAHARRCGPSLATT